VEKQRITTGTDENLWGMRMVERTRELSNRAKATINKGSAMRSDAYSAASEACDLNKKCVKKQEDLLAYLAKMRF
jgi:hypothetical protein